MNVTTTTATTQVGYLSKVSWGGVDYCLTQIDNLADLKYMDDCYFGEGGFRDGSYLEKYPRETDTGFSFRKKIATFPDVFRSEFDALVDPIFSKGVTRECEEDLVNAYLQSPRKRLGEDMDEFMTQVVTRGLLLGTVFVVTSGSGNVSASAFEDSDPQNLPRSMIVKPQDVAGYKLNDEGGLQVLVYLENLIAVKNNKVTPEYRVWLTDDMGDHHTFLVNQGGTYIADSYRPLEGMPVKMLEFNTRYKENRIARPKYYNVARKFLRIYLLTSNVDDSYWKNCFAILVYHGSTSDVSVGNDAIMQAPEDATTPSYIAPPVAHLDKMEVTMENDKKDAEEALTSSSAVATTASAEARIEVDRRRREILKKLSQKTQTFENAIVNGDLRFFIEGGWVCEITYNTDFDSASSADTIAVYDSLANSGMVVPEVQKLLGNKSIDILPNLSKEEKEEWKQVNDAGVLPGQEPNDPGGTLGDNVDDDIGDE